MKNLICVFLFIFIFFLPLCLSNKSKSMSKYDRYYNECKIKDCNYRAGDEDCIFQCISKYCYNQVIGNYLFELGEVNTDIKNRFEACFNALKK
jgi:hypothetical protein